MRNKRGTPPGTKFTPEHVEALTAGHLASEAWWEGRRRAAEKLKGRAPSVGAIAGSLASRSLRRLGLSKETSPTLYAEYVEHYTKQLEERAAVA